MSQPPIRPVVDSSPSQRFPGPSPFPCEDPRDLGGQGEGTMSGKARAFSVLDEKLATSRYSALGNGFPSVERLAACLG